jgi:eukaryotic-like serine/threonine-protein kinase
MMPAILMSLTPGSRLGPYEILSSLGEGGMGEVYRAHDVKLSRDVALKILPEAFVTDPDRLARFRREAQILASLNHPNIAAIYGFEDSGATHALVLELVDGPTLADRIAQGPIPLADALPIAKQITEALEAAHDLGIVHRDLKPANVKVRDDGTVKVLDFGLAKARDPASVSNANAANSPTLTGHATHVGLIIGTAAYMSPEQARGKAVDKRADIWAFGVVVYEMLTGMRAFTGEEISDVLAAVLRQDVDWAALPESTPASIRRLLARCLERDVKLRLRDIGEARVVLADPATPALADTTSAPRARGVWRLLRWAATTLLVLAAGAGWWGWFHPPATPPRAVTRSAMILPSSIESANDVALSRDGTRLAYWEGGVGHGHIVLRMMDQLEGKAIPGTDDGDWPVFSPDGQWIAFFSGVSPFKLKKISVTGGPPITLCDAGRMDSTFPSISWDDDETIVFGSDTGLMRVAAAGGKPEALTTIDEKAGETGHLFAQLLPGGQAWLFTISGTSAATARLAVLDLRTHIHRVLVNGAAIGRYVPTGHLVYQRGDALFAVPFDIKRLVVTGSETPVVEGVSRFDYTFSNTGLLVFTPAGSQGNSTLEWTDRKGAAQPLPAPLRAWGALALSPDGKLVAAAIRANVNDADSHTDIWKYDIERTTLTKMTFEGSNDVPVWSRDGQWVAYRSTRDGKSAIYRMSVNASGPPELVVAEPGFAVFPSSWAPDGTLLYSKREQASTAKTQIWILPAAGSDGQPQRLLQTAFDEWNPGVSPDGRSVAYMSEESGQPEIYVVPFPGPGGKVQVSTHGGVSPKWSRNGRELFYVEVNALGATSAQLMAVNMRTAMPGRPQPLFKVPGFQFEVTPDPQRFLVVRRQEDAKGTANMFIVITDWFEDLRRRAPITR